MLKVRSMQKHKISKEEHFLDFLKCKTAQDDSVDGVGTCKKVNKCGGAANKSDAQRILNILNP